MNANTVTTLEVAHLHPWKDQPRPRSRRDPAQDAELLESVRKYGVLQSLVVRPDLKKNGWIIVCGERRYNAAVAAGVLHVPATVRELTDAESLAMGLTENLQRQDMHPIDEAEALARLQKLDTALATPAALGASIGQTERHVRARLRLLRLGPLARQAFGADAITTQHAELLAAISDVKEQEEALVEACFYELFGDEIRKATKTGDWTACRDHVAPIAVLKDWKRENLVADIRAAEVQEELPELQTFVKEAKDAGTKIVQVSANDYNVPAGLLGTRDYRVVGKRKCAHQERAVQVHGGPTIIQTVCLEKTCKVHWPELNKPAEKPGAAAKRSPSEQKWHDQDARRRKQEAAWAKLRKAALPAVVKAITAHVKITAALVKDVLGSYATKQVHDQTAVKLSDDTAAAYLALHALDKRSHTRASFSTAAKAYKFDLTKFEREHTKALKAEKAAKAKAKKK